MTAEQEPNLRARRAYENAVYLMNLMGSSYDHNTGLFTTSFDELNEDETDLIRGTFSGTVGEVFTDEKFYIPMVDNEVDRIDLAFELGFLIGKELTVESQDG